MLKHLAPASVSPSHQITPSGLSSILQVQGGGMQRRQLQLDHWKMQQLKK